MLAHPPCPTQVLHVGSVDTAVPERLEEAEGEWLESWVSCHELSCGE